MRRKVLKDGILLRDVIGEYNQERTPERMLNVVLCFRDSELWLPCLADSKEADLLKSNGHTYLAVFSRKEEMDGIYDASYARLSYDALSLIAMAEKLPQVEGILIDGFSNPFMVARNLFDFVKEQPSQIDDSPEEALLEVGRLSTETTVRIAVPFDPESGKVFQHFGHTEIFKIYKVIDSDVVDTELVDTEGQGHSALAAFLQKQGVQFMICGGIGAGAIQALANYKIQVFGGVDDDADDAVSELLAGILLYSSDATCDHHGEGGCSCHEHEGEEGCGCGEDCSCHEE